MGKGRIRITNEAIAHALGFPLSWDIEEINPIKSRNDESEMLISGPDFPEINNRGDAEDCQLIVHTGRTWVEVKKSIRKEK